MTNAVKAAHGDEPDGPEDDRPENPGLYYPLDYVLLTWHEKNDHGLLPEAGGLNDQDWRLVYHDWPLITTEYNRIARALYFEDKDGRGIGAFTAEDVPDQLDDLMSDGS